MTPPHTKLKVGDLVQFRDDQRLGIVVSEVFDMRPTWSDFHPAVHVRTRHGLPPHDEGVWTWLFEDIEVLSQCQ